MVANLELMDDVDDAIDPGGPQNGLQAWQVRVRLIAVLIEVAHGSRPRSLFVEMSMREAARMPAADMQDISTVLARYYLHPEGAVGYEEASTRARMSADLQACIAMMPLELRAAFALDA